MAGTAAFYNDGTIPYGARLITVTRVATPLSPAYVFENVSLSRSNRGPRRYDELGAPNGSVGVYDFDTGSATVQLATTSHAQLRQGDIFSATFDDGTGSQNYVITDFDQPEGQVDYKKQNIRFIRKYN